MVVRRKGKSRCGLNYSKVGRLLSGFTFRPHIAYGGSWSGEEFDEAAARRDWDESREYLLPEFKRSNPGCVCWAEHHFDGVELPAGQDRDKFHRLDTKSIQSQFPMQ